MRIVMISRIPFQCIHRRNRYLLKYFIRRTVIRNIEKNIFFPFQVSRIQFMIVLTPFMNRCIEIISEHFGNQLPIVLPDRFIFLSVFKQKWQSVRYTFSIFLPVAVFQHLTPWNTSVFDGGTDSIQKSHFIAEYTGKIIKGLRRQSPLISFKGDSDKIPAYLFVQRTHCILLMKYCFTVRVFHPHAFCIRIFQKYLSGCRSGRESIFIVQPEFHTDTFRMQNNIRKNSHILFSQILRFPGIISGVENYSVKPQPLHLQ